MPANYDKIARIYDLLSRIVFGRNIVKAQITLLKFVQPNSTILIVGGGTGWILEELTKQHSSGLTIDYVENSAKMIALSAKRNCGNNTVNLINVPIESFKQLSVYDVIITPFIFDNFTDTKAHIIFNQLNRCLKNKGVWLFADFVNNQNENRLWQKFLLNVMYIFFRITCGIETSKLVDMEPYFDEGYQKVFEQSFYLRFIKATAYQKD